MNHDQTAALMIEQQKIAQIEGALAIARAAAVDAHAAQLAATHIDLQTTQQKNEHLAEMLSTKSVYDAQANKELADAVALRRGFPTTTSAQNTAVDPITGRPVTTTEGNPS